MLLLLSITSGCMEAPKGAPKYQVTGSLLVNGQPAEGAIIRLHALGQDLKGKDRYPYGVTDVQGKVSYATYTLDDGIPAGEYLVTIRWPFEQKINSPDRLRRKFYSKSKSSIRIKVEKDTTELAPFELDVPPEWLKPGSNKANTN